MRGDAGLTNPFTGALLGSLVAQAESAIEIYENDYEKDGILFCGDCNTEKQVRITIGGTEITVKCLCKCKTAERDQREAEEKQKQECERIQRLKSQGIQDGAIRDWTFENDDGRNPEMYGKAMRYYTKWQEMYEENIGILLWGDVGTGKTYFAACIANALLNDGVSVLMTSFPKIINALSDFNHAGDRNAYIESLNRYKLLVIDDLGAERQSEFAQEIVYSVINSRYESGRPVIITTNMTLDELKRPAPTDKQPGMITYKRIYDRILEMCPASILFAGESRRAIERKSKIEKARMLFGQEAQ